jgi:hypothetical protein
LALPKIDHVNVAFFPRSATALWRQIAILFTALESLRGLSGKPYLT